jgi:hypothetical protein
MVAQIFGQAHQRVRPATPLLAFIAGEFADAIAHVWPAPHADFFALPAGRRHAAAIALAGLATRELSAGDLRRHVAFARDAVVADLIAGDHAAGLMRALAKAGETLWARDDYAAFMSLLADPMANEVVRHMDAVRPDAFAPLAALPAPLRLAPVVRVVRSVAAANDLALAFRIAVRMRSPEAAPRLVRRWAAGGDGPAVFTRAQQDLTPDAFRPVGPAPVLAPPFVRIATRKQLEQVALEFRNCLVDHAVRIAEGRMAVYVWRDASAAAIALNWDVAGWRLAEAKAEANLDLDEPQLRALVAILETHGVRTGPSVQTLTHRLEDHINETTFCAQPGASFVDQLALGDLWS